jgi:threonine dehydratase
MKFVPDYDDVKRAYELVRPMVHRTPVLTSLSINQITGGDLWFKCENFQRVGAFKFRGASNAVFSLPDEDAVKGVATHSSGNHAAALALAARMRGIPAYIVMPRTSPEIKKAAVAGYGGVITLCEPTLSVARIDLAAVSWANRRHRGASLR